jgi:hypothetical protein
VAFFAPDATVTLAGKVAFTLLEESMKVVPPRGAAEAKVIVPVKELPPATVDALRERRAFPL